MSKSIIFLVKSFLGLLYWHLAIFSGHTTTVSVSLKRYYIFLSVEIGQFVGSPLDLHTLTWIHLNPEKIFRNNFLCPTIWNYDHFIILWQCWTKLDFFLSFTYKTKLDIFSNVASTIHFRIKISNYTSWMYTTRFP